MKRVCIDLRVLASGRRTGVEVLTERYVSDRVKRERDTQFIGYYNAYSGDTSHLDWFTSLPGTTLVRTRIPNKLLNFALWYLRFPYLDLLVGGVDEYVLPNMNFLKVSSRTTLTVIVHDFSYLLYPQFFTYRQRLWHYLVHPGKLYTEASTLVAVSESTAAELRYRYPSVPVSRVQVLPPPTLSGPILSRNDPKLFELSRELGLSLPFFFTLCTAEPRKNLRSLLSAFDIFAATHPTYRLIVAGAAGWGVELRESIARMTHSAQVVVVGYISEEHKAAYMLLAKAFVYPSYYEGLGIPVLEAATYGTPVITTAYSSLPEVAPSGSLLLDPLRPSDLASALQQLAS